MTAKGFLALVLLGTMGGAWWWTLAQPAFRGPASSAAPVATTGRTTAIAAPEVSLSRLRRPAAAVGPRVARNPFGRRGAGEAGDVPPRATRVAASDLGGDASMSPPAAPTWPRLELIGLASKTVDGTSTRVAVLAGDRGVLHATAGDIVAEVYRIERVLDDAVEVTLLPESRAFTLRLR